jgi:chloramphenicol 3-O-phosphotransferase
VASVPLVIFDEPEHVGTVQPEYLIWRDRAPSLHRGYLRAIGALARSGNHVAVSAGGHAQREFTEAFRDVALVTVGLTCDPDVLNTRERRSGRWGGIAAASLGVHDAWTYDLQFDTTAEPDPHEMARCILDRLGDQGATAPDPH